MIRYGDFYLSVLVFAVILSMMLFRDVAAASVSYLRKSSYLSENAGSFQQNIPSPEQFQRLSQNTAAGYDRPKRRFYARYENDDGRHLVRQLCGNKRIVEDLDSTDYTLFEDVDGEADGNENVHENSCWKTLQQRLEITWVEEDHPVHAFSIDGTDNNDKTESRDAWYHGESLQSKRTN
jgi:hypothetical protein